MKVKYLKEIIKNLPDDTEVFYNWDGVAWETDESDVKVEWLYKNGECYIGGSNEKEIKKLAKRKPVIKGLVIG